MFCLLIRSWTPQAQLPPLLLTPLLCNYDTSSLDVISRILLVAVTLHSIIVTVITGADPEGVQRVQTTSPFH